MSETLPRTLLRLYDKLSGLLEKLPGGLQKPILRELRPIRDLFLEQRPPRIMLVGDNTASIPTLLAALGASNARTGSSYAGWRVYSFPGEASIQILDARYDVPDAHIENAITHAMPDLALLLQDCEPSESEWNTTVARTALTQALLIALRMQNDIQSSFEELLQSTPSLSNRLSVTITLSDPAAPEILCAALPATAQIQFARLTNARRAQAFIASSLLKSFSGLCGVIGMQPIPLADLPILLTLQSLMIGLIIHTTGRRVNARLIAEFLGALGLGTAAAFAFREAARIAIRILPFWGHAVSGLVAGAGTYAIGRAAIAHFIDDTPLAETRRLFRKMLRKPTR